MIAYRLPEQWIRYDPLHLLNELVAAKAAVLALTTIPAQRTWAEELQVVQLKREVAGTSRIEGADFTDRELDAALQESPEQLHTRSQRQAACAVAAYRWITKLPNDRPIDEELVCEIHRLIITGSDEDHCPPGRIRERDQNVNFGVPRHRGASGGPECAEAFKALFHAVRTEFRNHDPLIQALALHYHFAAMHPFLDGNGRTARAVEALMLQRVGLRDTLFIAMSNYYYEEKTQYLGSLAKVWTNNHDLTVFLKFGLKGIELQCQRLFKEIKAHVSRALYRNLMFDLFNRMRTSKKRVIAERHIEILKLLLGADLLTLEELREKTNTVYRPLGNPFKALIRDINYLLELGAIGFKKIEPNRYQLFIRLEWPTEITETEFFARIKQMPKAKTHRFLS